MNLQTLSLDTVSPGARTEKKPFRKAVFFLSHQNLSLLIVQQHNISVKHSFLLLLQSAKIRSL